jgi:hypothetical protein
MRKAVCALWLDGTNRPDWKTLANGGPDGPAGWHAACVIGAIRPTPEARMPLIVLTAVIQLCFVVHVIRTGRPYYWAIIIMSFPVVGCVAYYFAEIFPNSREHRSARRAAAGIVRALQPDAQFKRRMQEVETCGSVDNKAALADECLRMGFTEDAVRLYEGCLAGPHANDAQLLFGLAQAHFAHQQFERAEQSLARLLDAHPAFKAQEARLLRARILEGLGREQEALHEYEELVDVYVGLEAKVRYGQLLRRMGYETQACSVFQGIVEYARRVRITHDAEREWLGLARRSVRAPS